MKKIIFLILLFFVSFISFGQVYQEMPQYGYRANRMAFDSSLIIPTTCGVPTLRTNITKKAAIAFDSCNNRFYQYNPKTSSWSIIGGGSDTFNLQQVTDAGDSTTNDIYVYYADNPNAKTLINNNFISISTPDEYDNNDAIYSVLTPNDLTLINRSPFEVNNDSSYLNLSYNKILFNDINNNSYLTLKPIYQSNKKDSFYLPIPKNTTDTLATLADVRSNKIDTTNKFVNQIYRTVGVDSIYYKIGSTTYAIKDSIGTGGGQNGRFGNDTATIVMAKVHNDAGVTLTNGKVVAFSTSGTSSDAPSVKLANNKADSTSATTFGFVSGTIAVNDTGYVILLGKIEKLNTSAFANGDIIYLDSISGQYTKNKPQAPYHLVYLGTVVKANAGNGAIYARVANGYELEELHNVKITSPQNNQVLAYSDTQQLWKNRNIYSIVDTITTVATKSNVALKLNISDTANKWVNTITRTEGKDSIIFYIGGTRYAIKDSTGGGGTTYTFSTGLTNTANTITNNLSTGVSGGQSVIGGTAASNSLTLSSTSNATKGNIFFGSNAFVDEVNNTLKIGNVLPPTDNAAFKMQVTQEASSATYVATCFSNTLAEGPNFNFAKYKGTAASPLAVASDDRLGQFTFLGYDGSARQASAGFLSVVDGAVSSGVLPARLEFQTGTSGAGRATQMTIKSDGNVLIGTTTNAGFKFDVNGTARIVTSLQTPQINGNTTSGGTLTLQSTTNATKGKILFGTSAYDEVNNRLGIGTTAPTYSLEVKGSSAGVFLGQRSADNTGSANAYFYKTRGTVASPTAVINGDGIGVFNFGGHDGTNIVETSFFGGIVDNTVSTSTVPIALRFVTGTTSANKTERMRISSAGGLSYEATNTASGTTGNQTINKISGTVNIAAAGTTVTVTNSLVTTSSIVFATIRTNDATAVIKNVVPGAGSFTINLNAAATAETSIGFFVIN